MSGPRQWSLRKLCESGNEDGVPLGQSPIALGRCRKASAFTEFLEATAWRSKEGWLSRAVQGPPDETMGSRDGAVDCWEGQKMRLSFLGVRGAQRWRGPREACRLCGDHTLC